MTENRASLASQKYDAENTKRIYIKLNRNTDSDIIDVLESKSNIQGYVKSLIRKDMESMKEYEVVTFAVNAGDDSEYTQLVTRDIDKAIKTARDFRDHYHESAEIRAYADPDREENGNWDYDTVEF